MSGQSTPPWLTVGRGETQLIVSLPHTGTDVPPDIEGRLVSPWLARKDTDWWIDRLYGFAADLGATTVRTAISRTAVDVNRDPTGASLYPGQTTTELCPTTTFDGQALYLAGETPTVGEIAARRAAWFDPYHAALAGEIARLRIRHGAVVLYDAHSIRSRVPQLFGGELPIFNIGTNAGAACDPALTAGVEAACAGGGGFSRVTNGRFKGGYTTRRYGAPQDGVHAIQMEIACRGYMAEPDAVTPDTWPGSHDPVVAAPMTEVLGRVLATCLDFAASRDRP